MLLPRGPPRLKFRTLDSEIKPKIKKSQEKSAGLEISASHRSLSGKFFHFDRQILSLTGHA